MRARWPILIPGVMALGVLLVGGLVSGEPSRSRRSRTPGRRQTMETRPLTPLEERVIVHKGTERAFSGQYWDHHADGVYHCRRCGAALFRSEDKFDSGSGWPSFDQGLPGALKEVRDADGHRTEVVCAACDGHLGHVFRGEGFTQRGVRHCVNSAALDFAPPSSLPPADASASLAEEATEEAFFAGGCFWGVEHLLEQVEGVTLAESGYMGGSVADPTYEQVSTTRTGHAEAVRVLFDPARTSYEALARLFFEIHDPTQEDRQGPDRGPQYRSAVFPTSPAQRAVAQRLMGLLRDKGLKVATRIEQAGPFYRAEEYHQDWYQRKGTQPYCHARTPRFGDE